MVDCLTTTTTLPLTHIVIVHSSVLRSAFLVYGANKQQPFQLFAVVVIAKGCVQKRPTGTPNVYFTPFNDEPWHVPSSRPFVAMLCGNATPPQYHTPSLHG